MKISSSKSFQNEKNTEYKHRLEIKNLEELKEAVRYDHCEAEFINGYRSIKNFIQTDCLIMDVDNKGVDEENFLTPELLQKKYFPNVVFFVIFSRNNGAWKKSESPRPRFHVYLPLKSAINDIEKSKHIKECLISFCPYFDNSAKDCARFFFGVENPSGKFFDGSVKIDEFLENQKIKPDFEERTRPRAEYIVDPKNYEFDSPINSLEELKNFLPCRPYCSNALETGLFIRPKEKALQTRYIQLNPPNMVKFLTFDIDYCCPSWGLTLTEARQMLKLKNFYFSWGLFFDDPSEFPPPCFIVQSRSNGHAHFIYVLTWPVCTTQLAHVRPIKYLDRIIKGLTKKFNADPAYNGLISKNPFNKKAWDVLTAWDFLSPSQPVSYSLNWLEAFIPDEEKPIKKAREDITALGRNCSIMEKVRLWSYRERRSYWGKSSEEWFNAVYQQCKNENSAFKVPLENYELKAIAKSISRWTIKNITPQGFSERQSRVRMCRTTKYSQKQDGIDLLRQGYSVEEIMEALDVSRRTVFSWKKEIPKEKEIITTASAEWENLGISRATYFRRKLYEKK